MAETATTDEVKMQLDQFRSDFGTLRARSARSSSGCRRSSTTR